MRANGTSVRTSNHASPVPRMPAATLTMTAICTVRHSGAIASASTSATSASNVISCHTT